jgi:hypothetical protein
MVNETITTEEIDSGILSTVEQATVGTAPVEQTEFELGVVSVTPKSGSSPVSEEKVATYSSANTPLPAIAPVDDTAVSIHDVDLVYASFSGGCQTLSALIEATGLSKSVVFAALGWLQKQERITVSGSFYCSVSNIEAMRKQLKQCINCCK